MVAVGQDTPEKRLALPGWSGVGWIPHPAPSRRSARVWASPSRVESPTAVQLVAEGQETPKKIVDPEPDGVGVAWMVQADPFHTSTRVPAPASPTAVQAVHDEPDLDALTRHELRWMRTIHKLRPWSFRLIFLTFSLPMAIAGFALSAAAAEPMFTLTARWLLAIVLAARLGVHFAHRIQSNQAADRSALADLWLVPVRDALLGWYWFVSFLSSRISWRGGEFNVDADGIMH